MGPQELDTWLVGTVRALQESMRDVQGRLQSLESMPSLPEQVSYPQGPRRDWGRAPWGSPPGSSWCHLCLLVLTIHWPTSLTSAENGVAPVTGRAGRGDGSASSLEGRVGRALLSAFPLLEEKVSVRTNSSKRSGRPGCVCSFHWGWGSLVSWGSLVPLRDFCSQI